MLPREGRGGAVRGTEAVTKSSQDSAPAGTRRFSGVTPKAAAISSGVGTAKTFTPSGTPPAICASRSVWATSTLAPLSRRM